MAELAKKSSFSQSLITSDAEAIKHLKQAITDGKHWYLSLLEAIGLWGSAEEVRNGRLYRYLIEGEVFDWLLLAERLCEEVDGLLPADDKDALLFRGKPPLDLKPEQLKELIGSGKYHQYLNYFYGITVEKALILAVEEEVHKERLVLGSKKESEVNNEAYRRIYGATKLVLLKRFRREKRYPQLKSITLPELKEFTYWLFKYRLKECDKARVASDTRKAMGWLKRQWVGKGIWGILANDSLLTGYDW